MIIYHVGLVAVDFGVTCCNNVFMHTQSIDHFIRTLITNSNYSKCDIRLNITRNNNIPPKVKLLLNTKYGHEKLNVIYSQ